MIAIFIIILFTISIPLNIIITKYGCLINKNFNSQIKEKTLTKYRLIVSGSSEFINLPQKNIYYKFYYPNAINFSRTIIQDNYIYLELADFILPTKEFRNTTTTNNVYKISKSDDPTYYLVRNNNMEIFWKQSPSDQELVVLQSTRINNQYVLHFVEPNYYYPYFTYVDINFNGMTIIEESELQRLNLNVLLISLV